MLTRADDSNHSKTSGDGTFAHTFSTCHFRPKDTFETSVFHIGNYSRVLITLIILGLLQKLEYHMNLLHTLLSGQVKRAILSMSSFCLYISVHLKA